MKKKNGFVFVETMIVVVVLVTTLLIIYSSYTGIISIERRRARYDDPSFIYKTKTIADFLVELKDEEGNSIIGNKVNEVKGDTEGFIIISQDDTELFGDNNSNRQSFFSQMYNGFNIQSIVLINKQQIANVEEEEISSDFYKYLNSLDTSNDNNEQFYFTIMFAEKVNGKRCDPNELINGGNDLQNNNNANQENKCTFYYSSLKLNIGE